MDMVTTKEALKILEARGLDVPYPTLALWVREGRFEGAELDENNPRGAVWYIPRQSVETFTPPPRGRTPGARPAETTEKLNKAFREATKRGEQAGAKPKGSRKGGEK